MSLLVSFPGEAEARIDRVGGKASSLIRMAAAGVRVPAGVVLTTDFFAAWLDAIRGSRTWTALRSADPSRWPRHCERLKSLVAELRWTEEQRRGLDALHEGLPDGVELSSYAVRSSSPDEDLGEASFAGGYVTRLGVQPAGLEAAIRECFASALDARVLVYKRNQGLDPWNPRIAVVVQSQLDSEVAGVGFSLNPLTNDFDEAVIDANCGLGESVVSGRVTPDHWVVDKPTGAVVEAVLGTKARRTVLAAGGGVHDIASEAAEGLSLTAARVSEVTRLLDELERLFGWPVDVEWAYAGDELYALQARPVTTYVPLPKALMTGPGARRRLYGDAALAAGFTTNEPISSLSLDSVRTWLRHMGELFVGPAMQRFGSDDTYIVPAGGRVYLDLSNLLWMYSPRRLAKRFEKADAVYAELVARISTDRYRAQRKPRWARPSMLRHVPRMLWGFRGTAWNTLRALVAPRRMARSYRRAVEAFEATMARARTDDCSLQELHRRYAPILARHLFEWPGAVLIPALIAQGAVDRIAGKRSNDNLALAEQLKRGYGENLVARMGVAMAGVAERLTPGDVEDIEALASRIEARDMPADFLGAWDTFVERFGCRGPSEMDLARPRYGEDPRVALRQIAPLVAARHRFDPAAAHEAQVRTRRDAYHTLQRRLGLVRRALLRHVHCVLEHFAGERDTPKHHIAMFLQAVREHALAEGRALTEAGRLDAAEEIFGLTIEDLTAADEDASIDLRRHRAERMRFVERLRRQVRHFPPLIDSRGRIQRPAPSETKGGALHGIAISPGRVGGPVKVLVTPDEKPVDEGDILVAYTTDPGWTPLFVNAAAIVLEVGGTLQHGAVVAREYGKPCVAGIAGITQRLTDGEWVEVDGTSGVVTLTGGAMGRSSTSDPAM